jgi:hypothetical protein
LSNFVIGLDLGQAQDYTALAILERIAQYDGAFREKPPMLHCRHLERYALGTRYPAIVTAVGDMLERPLLKGADLVIDATGVGRAVCDMFTAAKIPHMRVLVTAGDDVNEEGGYFKVPKRDLAGAVQAPLQDHRLKFADGLALGPTLVTEMLNFKVKITAAANDTYGAWREGEHDDLIFAVMLACWWAQRRAGGSVTQSRIKGRPHRPDIRRSVRRVVE